MKEASDEILKTLQKRGYRVTQARTEVVEALTHSHEPVTIQLLSTKVLVDEVSVYRTIATLMKEKLVEEINMQGGVSRYALSHEHHHHVVCQNCEMVVHVACSQEPKIPQRVQGFSKIYSHEIIFYGLCNKCA